MLSIEEDGAVAVERVFTELMMDDRVSPIPPMLWRRVFLWGVMALAVLVPLAIIPETDDATVIKGGIFYLLVSGMGICWIIGLLQNVGRSARFAPQPPRIPIAITPIHLPLGCLLGVIALSSCWSAARYASLSVCLQMAYYIGLYGLCLMVLDARAVRRIVTAFLITGGAIAGYGLLQHLHIDVIQWGTNFATEDGFPRVFATLGHPNFLGGYLILILSIAIPCAIVEEAIAKRLGYLAVIAVAGLCLIYTLSRGAWVGLGVSLLVLGLPQLRAIVSKRVTRYTIGLTVAGLVMLLLLLPSARQRLTSRENFPARVALWQSAYSMFRDAPLLGHGSGTFRVLFPQYRPHDYWLQGIDRTVAHAHNEFLEIAAETGVLGLSVFVWALVRLFHWMVTAIGGAQDARDRALLTGLTAAIAGTLAHNLVDVSLRWTAVAVPFWLVVALAGVLAVEKGGDRVRRGIRLAQLRVPVLSVAARWGVMTGSVVVLSLVGVNEVRVVLVDRALLAGQRAIDRREWSTAISTLQAVVRLAPTNLSALYKLGFAFIQIGSPRPAIQVFHRLERLAPHYAEVDHNLGVAYLQLGALPDAIRRYETAARLDHTERNQYDLAQLYEMNHDRTRAIQAYEVFLPLVSSYLTLHQTRQRHHQMRGTSDRAAIESRLIEEANSRVRYAQDYLMEEYQKAGNWERAIQVFQPWSAQQPGHPRAHYFLGYAFQQLHRYDHAVAEYKATLALDPRNAPALNNLGVIYTEQGRQLDSAIALIQRALQIAPEDAPYYLDSLGWAYFKKGDDDLAVHHLQEGIARCPSDDAVALAELSLHLGMIYEQRGQQNLALSQLQRARALGQMSTVGQTAQELLRRIAQTPRGVR